jgi:uncharacterized protein
MVTRVSATDRALFEIKRLEALHGPLFFHQSAGCCDGSSPMCYPRGEFKIGEQDVKVGDIGGQPFYMGAAQWTYWQDMHLIVDVVNGRGSGFSLEAPDGIRFLARGRPYTDEEFAELEKLAKPLGAV